MELNSRAAIKKVLCEDVIFWKDYPKTAVSNGQLTILPSIPNTASIAASFNRYKKLDGIREIALNAFSDIDFYAKAEWERVKVLQEEIETSRSIKPIIAVLDEEDSYQSPYILEGAHRVAALKRLPWATSVPALVVLDLDSFKDPSSDAD